VFVNNFVIPDTKIGMVDFPVDPDRVFCGRRKTDLTPTFPIRREDGSTSRSTSRAGTASAGRVYCSMTRLDHGSRSPVRQSGTQRSMAPTQRSKSTNQLVSSPGKQTRTEILRQNLVTAKGREVGSGGEAHKPCFCFKRICKIAAIILVTCFFGFGLPFRQFLTTCIHTLSSFHVYCLVGGGL